MMWNLCVKIEIFKSLVYFAISYFSWDMQKQMHRREVKSLTSSFLGLNIPGTIWSKRPIYKVVEHCRLADKNTASQRWGHSYSENMGAK